MTTVVPTLMHAVQHNNHCVLNCKVTVNDYILQRLIVFFFRLTKKDRPDALMSAYETF